MMNKPLDLKDAFKAISEVERDSNIPSTNVFSQDIHLDRVAFNKLKLLGFVKNQSRNHILRNLVAAFIREFEIKNGSIVQLAKSKIQESDSENIKRHVRNYKSIPEA